MAKLHRKSILTKTATVAATLLFSKLLGVVREVVQVQYLPVGPLSDAFNTALKIPNLLRKIFAEGALSAAFVPTIIKVTAHDSQKQASRLMSMTYVIFGTIILALCMIISFFPETFITLISYGYKDKPIEMANSVKMIRVLIYFVYFMFTSALLASALQAKLHFAAPAWGPTLLNVFYIAGLGICYWFGFSVDKFAYFLLFGGLVQTLVYAAVYFHLNFTIEWPDRDTYKYFMEVLIKFIPCLLSVSIIEINLIIDNRFASTLPAGSQTLLSISSKFMTIALGAFAVAFSTILLPHFSRISTYAPKRLSYYLLESTKFIFWITVPIALLMSFFSYNIFYTIFYRLTSGFPLANVAQAASLLVAFLPGLFFFSVNKILLNIFYAFHETRYPMYITITGVVINVVLNRFLMPIYGAFGIALATVIAGVVQTILLLTILNIRMGLKLYLQQFGRFLLAYTLQLIGFMGLFFALYKLGVFLITHLLSRYEDLLLHTIGLWFWVGPLCLIPVGVLYYLRNKAGVRLHFLE